jgi:CDP-4-dehydro-6-deoxyglucose reductase
VRRVAGGEFSAPLFGENARGSLLTIEGPLGQFVYRQGSAPMLLVGGGTGLAPLLSILRHVVENDIERDMTVYWGVRGDRDLYAHATLEELAGRPAAGRPTAGRPAARIHYIPVLSEPSPDWRGRSGWLHEAVLEDIDDLEKYDVYVAGPPAMVAAARRDFVLRGADAGRLFFDSFDYAPDTLERQWTSADTKS